MITGIVVNPTVVWQLYYPTMSNMRYMSIGIIFPSQNKAKGGQKNCKCLRDVRIRKRMVSEGRRKGKKHS